MAAVCAKHARETMAQTIKWLFVYGTLLSRSRDLMGREMRWQLQRHCLWRRSAMVPGLLFDLGGYPGWVEQRHTNRCVYGELLLLGNAPKVFRWLDPYENFDPLRPIDGEYVREVRRISLHHGETVDAWIYRYRGDRADKRWVSHGSWLLHA